DHLLRHFGQTSITKSYPGVIKAFHWHYDQDDLWYVVDGMARVVLYDRRPDSPTHGVTQVVYAGEDNPVLIVIPIGVAHGYHVLCSTPVILFYHATKADDPHQPDEQLSLSDDPEPGFDGPIRTRGGTDHHVTRRYASCSRNSSALS